MLFRQKEKVVDVGKDNFRDFMRREGDSCMNTQLKLSTFVNKTVPNELTQSQQKQSSLTPSALDGSLKMLGNTWDAKHLGQFLQKSQFATLGGNSLKPSEPFQDSFKNQSFFFRSQQPRIIDERIDYLHQHHINHLISDYPLQKSGSDILKWKLLEVPLKQFDETKLNYLTEHPQLKGPRQQLNDMREAKDSQQKFHQWRSEFQDVNRAYKKAKFGCKSGLYALDNPLNENTELYKEEHQRIRELEQRSVRNGLNRYKSLEKFNCSNPAIEFDNVVHQPLNQIDPLLQKEPFPKQNFEMSDQWKKRKQIAQGLDTQQRVFGDTDSLNKVNSQRTLYLRNQDVRGRDYNLINLTKSVIG